MQYRPLGNSGEKISAVSAGCWAAGGVGWGGTDDRKTSDAFARALDLEINLFDTAPVYGFGHSERVLGRALKTRRDNALIATKFGLIWEREETASIANDLRPKSIKAACEQSLKDLQTDRIDLYQCHWPLPGDAMTRTVCEDMIAALLDLRESGKVRFFGVSNFSIEQIELCGGAETIASVQPPLSILCPAQAETLTAYCQERGIGVICYSPMQRGLLSGRFKGDETFPEDDTRGGDPNYQGERFRAICGRVADLRSFAETHESTIAAVSLNWVLSAPGVTSAIAGVRSEAQIEEVAGAQGWSLSPDERAEIAEMFAEFTKPPAAS